VRKPVSSAAAVLLFLCLALPAAAQEDNVTPPPLYFREDFREIPAETPITREHILNEDLVLGLHGPGRDMIKKSHHEAPPDDPWYVWSGQCGGTWAVTLSKRGALVDLTDGGVGWRTKNFDRVLHVVVGLENGDWLVSSRGTGETPGWHEFTIGLAGMGWKKLDIDTVTAGDAVEKPDLGRVRSIGFTDLMAGGRSASCSRLDWIEVYGREVGKERRY